jgi:hypothetical protein
MKKFNPYEFLRGDNAPVFALVALFVAMSQMYVKLYFHYNAYNTNVPILDILIALVSVCGLATITIIIIMHTKNKMSAYWFSLLDFFGGFIFYGYNLFVLWDNEKWIDMLVILYLPLLKSCALFFISEIFLRRSNELHELTQKDNKTIIELSQSNFDLQKELDQTLISLSEQQKQVSELNYKLTSFQNDHISIETSLTAELERLKVENSRIPLSEAKIKLLEIINMVWEIGQEILSKKKGQRGDEENPIINTLNDQKRSLLLKSLEYIPRLKKSGYEIPPRFERILREEGYNAPSMNGNNF